MPWNPDVYTAFSEIRNKPFYDLTTFIQSFDHMKIVDLGCGTGEQAAILAEKFESSTVLGVDASAEMLQKSAQYASERVRFRNTTIEEMTQAADRWDLVFSNAALQWSDDHEVLFPRLINLLRPNGQFVVQMPVQPENLLNMILLDLVAERPFVDYLHHWRRESPVLSMDAYTSLLFEAGLVNLRVEQRVYPIVAQEHEHLYNFISGSALIPYIEKLEPKEQALFVPEFKKRIAAAFPKLPAIYAFKRLLLYGQRPE